MRYVLQLSQESWIENRSVVPIAGIGFLGSHDMGKGQGLKAPTYLGATNAALKGRSSTVVQKACSCTGFNVAFRT